MANKNQLFKDVYNKVRGNQYANEASFRQDFVEALKNELNAACPERARLVNPVLEYKVGLKKRADTRVFNIFLEFEVPPSNEGNVTRNKEIQILDYLDDLAKVKAKNNSQLLGFVTNGWKAEIFKYPAKTASQSSNFMAVSNALIPILCQSANLGITEPDDFIALFGAW